MRFVLLPITLALIDLNSSYTTITKSPYFTNNYVKPTKHEITWYNRLQDLIDFKNEYGTCHVPYSANPKLSSWVSSQRYNYKQNRDGKATSLTSERINQLDEIGFIWEANKYKSSFDKRLEELKIYKNRHGHCNVRMDENPSLAKWVQNQINEYSKLKHEKKTGMTMERASLLLSVGVEFEKQDSWEQKLQQMRKLQQKYGNQLDVANLAHEETKQLRNWICNQRAQYKLYQQGKKSNLTPERIKSLNEISFDWGERITPWSTRFQELCQYKAMYGDCLVPQSYDQNPQLGTWVKAQRRHGKLFQSGEGGSMTLERYRKLDDIDFTWELKGRSARKMSMEKTLSERLASLKFTRVNNNHKLICF